MNRKLYIHQRRDGCIESFLDFARSRNALKSAGWTVTRRVDEADMVLVNTCVVGEIVQLNCMNDIADLKSRMKPDAELVVTGCLPAYDEPALATLGVDFAFSPRRLEDFLKRYNLLEPAEAEELEQEYLGPYNLFNWVNRLLSVADTYRLPIPQYLYRRFTMIEDENQHYLRISRGCLEKCTYCATKFTTGELCSAPPELILKRFDAALERGKRSFAICAEDTGAYGADIGTNLPKLLSRMLERQKDFTINIRQHQPNWIIKYQAEYLKVLSDPRVKSIMIPFQSGSDRILRLMGRRYNSAQVVELVRAIHEDAPHVMLRTHAIVGFPTETWEEFRLTCELVKNLPWDMVLVFPYTDRPRTAAFRIEPKVSTAAITARSWILNFIVLRKIYLNDFNPFPLARSNPMRPPRLFE